MKRNVPVYISAIQKLLHAAIIIALTACTLQAQSLPPKYRASETSAINLNLAKDKSGNQYMIYKDLNTGKATVRKFDGTSWKTVGNANFSAGVIYYPSIAVSSTGTPYVVFGDASKNYKATVMMFDGTAWVNVGAAGISTGTAAYTSITINNAGVPYIVYQDYGAGYEAVVKRFNGTKWVSVSDASLPLGIAYYTYITTGPDGKIYVACYDYNVGTKGRVVVLDGGKWKDVGNPGFSSGNTNFITLKFDKNKVPYVAYEDGYLGNGTMMKLQNNKWVTVGKPQSIGDSISYYITFDFSPQNEPYVAYQDRDIKYNAKLSVLKFNGSKFVPVGPKGFTLYVVEYPNLFFDKTGLPSVVYTDYSRNFNATLTQYVNNRWTEQQTTLSSFKLDNLKSPAQASIKLYPNPTAADAVLMFNSKENNLPYQIIITDNTGKLLWVKKGTSVSGNNNTVKLDVSRYAAGIFNVELITPGRTEKLKLVKLSE